MSRSASTPARIAGTPVTHQARKKIAGWAVKAPATMGHNPRVRLAIAFPLVGGRRKIPKFGELADSRDMADYGIRRTKLRGRWPHEAKMRRCLKSLIVWAVVGNLAVQAITPDRDSLSSCGLRTIWGERSPDAASPCWHDRKILVMVKDNAHIPDLYRLNC